MTASLTCETRLRPLGKSIEMLTKRIIPCLDVKAGRVVKGVRFVNLRDAGDPVEAVDGLRAKLTGVGLL